MPAPAADPAPLTDDGSRRLPGGSAAGFDVLPELPPGVGFSVGRVLRAVLLWATQSARRREKLFVDGFLDHWEAELLSDALEPDIRFPLAVIVGELAAGEAASASRVSWSCVCVTDWALGKGARRAAVAFAEAAALVSPEAPRYAWLAGRLLRAHGNVKTADIWLRKALRLAAAQRDWETQARALTALGNLFVETGKYPKAKELHTRALRISRRYHLHEQEGMALHDLFVIAIEEGHRAEAERHARGALDAYMSCRERIPKLAHDVAYSWMDQGYFSRALNVFLALRKHFPRPDDQMRVIGNVARAAGGCGDRETFVRMWHDAQELQTRLVTRATLPTALLEMAHGAVSLQEWNRATEAALQAMDAARERSEGAVLHRAEMLLEAVRQQRAASPARTALPGGTGPADRFAAELVSRLEQEPEPAAR